MNGSSRGGKVMDNTENLIEQFYTTPYTRKLKTRITTDWNERVVQAVVTWFEIKMNEALKVQDIENNMFNLTESFRLLMQEAPGVEAFFIQNGAEEFLRDEVEIIVGWETDEDIATRMEVEKPPSLNIPKNYPPGWAEYKAQQLREKEDKNFK
jgi:hypothetical protein